VFNKNYENIIFVSSSKAISGVSWLPKLTQWKIVETPSVINYLRFLTKMAIKIRYIFWK